MPLMGRWGVGPDRQCGYFHDRLARMEIMWLDQVGAEELSALLNHGYRHFGRHFFRPHCRHCSACVPLRVPVRMFVKTRSVRKTLKRARHLQSRLSGPQPSREAYRLYSLHKSRFDDCPAAQEAISYEAFVESFFCPFPFARVLEIRDAERLVAVAHFDMTPELLSAIYCYYDTDYLHYSPGRLAIYLQLEIAARQNLDYVHLGYYIQHNRHMAYKADFRPNEILLAENNWVPFIDAQGERLVDQESLERGFQSPGRLDTNLLYRTHAGSDRARERRRPG